MKRSPLLTACVLLLLVGSASILASRIVIARAAQGKTYSAVDLIPHRHVGLLLGCPKRAGHGLFFRNRIDAAAELFAHGKVDTLIVSGDNHAHGYNEPEDMKNALLAKGIPADRIYPDYAGFRTLDSVVRAKEIFGQDSIIVISQRFHNQRAIFLAGHHGIDAIGFNAPDVELRYGYKTVCREQLAKVKAILDIYVLRKQPHFLGQKIAIGSS